jgi:hypothetical protein
VREPLGAKFWLERRNPGLRSRTYFLAELLFCARVTLMVMPSLRTRSIGTKISGEEYAQMERAAQMAAKTLGEWVSRGDADKCERSAGEGDQDSG